MKKIKILLTAFILLNLAYAHSGRTDQSGGHNCSQKSINKGLCSGYHYHNKAPALQNIKTDKKMVNTPIPAQEKKWLGNQVNDSFSQAKKTMLQNVYYDHLVTFYCRAEFNMNQQITDLNGFQSDKHLKRQAKIEWEHIVPAENFGRTFTEWRDGHRKCINNKGERFKGRQCASKVSAEYRLMQSDLYNLAPAIGAVNALRSNYNFTQWSSEEKASFGSCTIEINNRSVQPPSYTRGFIARTYLYMQDTYPRFKMSNQQNKLMQAWNKQYPVSNFECTRAKRIEALQKNKNTFVLDACS